MDKPARVCPTVVDVPAGWSVKSLSSICCKIGTGATPRGGSEVYLGSRTRYALVRSQHVFDRHFDQTGLAFISDQHARELRNAEIQSGDVLLNITGDGVTFARACTVPDEILPACVNQHVCIIRPKRGECESGYLLSVLTHPASKAYIESFNSGGSRRAITKGHIESFLIPLPPLAEQKAIASILGALDDKIELNRRMNETLEAMARALFQSWFVDFDPVRAKLDGRPPVGLDPAIADMFPGTFQDSELGHIPLSWGLTSVSECTSALFDGPHATPPTAEAGPIFLGISNFRSNSLDLSTIKHICEDDFPRWTRRVLPQEGDIVFTYEAALGLFAMIPPGIRCCLGRRIALIRPLTERKDSTYLLHWFISRPFQEYLRSHQQPGSTVDRIWLTEFPNFPVLKPSLALVDRFEEFGSKIWAKIHANQQQSRTLAALRDTLLPKLLSGELSVKHLESQVAAVV